MWIYFKVNSSIFLLRSFGRSLSPSCESCVSTSFERSVYPKGCINLKTVARIFRRSTAKEGQSNKKCASLGRGYDVFVALVGLTSISSFFNATYRLECNKLNYVAKNKKLTFFA